MTILSVEPGEKFVEFYWQNNTDGSQHISYYDALTQERIDLPPVSNAVNVQLRKISKDQLLYTWFDLSTGFNHFSNWNFNTKTLTDTPLAREGSPLQDFEYRSADPDKVIFGWHNYTYYNSDAYRLSYWDIQNNTIIDIPIAPQPDWEGQIDGTIQVRYLGKDWMTFIWHTRYFDQGYQHMTVWNFTSRTGQQIIPSGCTQTQWGLPCIYNNDQITSMYFRSANGTVMSYQALGSGPVHLFYSDASTGANTDITPDNIGDKQIQDSFVYNDLVVFNYWESGEEYWGYYDGATGTANHLGLINGANSFGRKNNYLFYTLNWRKLGYLDLDTKTDNRISVPAGNGETSWYWYSSGGTDIETYYWFDASHRQHVGWFNMKTKATGAVPGSCMSDGGYYYKDLIMKLYNSCNNSYAIYNITSGVLTDVTPPPSYSDVSIGVSNGLVTMRWMDPNAWQWKMSYLNLTTGITWHIPVIFSANGPPPQIYDISNNKIVYKYQNPNTGQWVGAYYIIGEAGPHLLWPEASQGGDIYGPQNNNIVFDYLDGNTGSWQISYFNISDETVTDITVSYFGRPDIFNILDNFMFHGQDDQGNIYLKAYNLTTKQLTTINSPDSSVLEAHSPIIVSDTITTSSWAEPMSYYPVSLTTLENGKNYTLMISANDAACGTSGSESVPFTYNGEEYMAFSVCGNGLVEGTEICDGTDWNGLDCVSQGYTGGTLGCSVDCMSYDKTDCFTTPTHQAGGGGGGTTVTEVLGGGTFDMQTGDTIPVDVGGESHTIRLVDVTPDSATIDIMSPLRVTLNLGEIKDVDVNGNGINDLRVELLQIILPDTAVVKLTLLSEKAPAVAAPIIPTVPTQQIPTQTAMFTAQQSQLATFTVFVLIFVLAYAIWGTYKRKPKVAHSESLHDYVSRELSKGHSKRQVGEKLRSAGWREERIKRELKEF